MDHQWLNTQFRLYPDKSKAGLADAAGLSASAISKILAGTRQIKAAEYNAMRRYFGLPVDGERAVRQGTGTGAADNRSYVLAPLTGGLRDSAAPPEEAWVMPARVLRHRTEAQPDKIRIFAVQDNAMAPDFTAGSHVLIDMTDTKPSPPGVFVVSDGMGHMIRQCEYVPYSKPPMVRLSVSGGRFEPKTLKLEQAGLIGRVIARLEWL